VLSLFIIGHMGLFFYNKIGSIISIVDLPTTNIIEPFFIQGTLLVNKKLKKSQKKLEETKKKAYN
ncbi:hypothetical protein, partial [Streptococcus pneumoniae]|uniref:hypothetical protein n=1 Tax=Streptococcus pneumoniae TaxID=1313 RepID=UPI00099A423A